MKHKHIKPKMLVFEVEVSHVAAGGLEPTQTRLVWGVSREDALRRARLRVPDDDYEYLGIAHSEYENPEI